MSAKPSEADQMAAALNNIDGMPDDDDNPLAGNINDPDIDDDDLDNDADDDQDDDIDDDDVDNDDDQDDDDDDMDADPPGYVSPEDWIAAGNSMDDWQGKNKYRAQYNLIQDNKGIRADLKGINEMLQQTVDATQIMKEKAYQDGLEEAKSELTEALANNDAKAVNDARDKLEGLDKPVSKVSGVPQAHPLHQDFFASNPVIDKDAGQFDGDVMKAFIRIHDAKLQADGVTKDTQLSEAEVKGYMKQALKGAKALFPDKFESRRNKRQSGKQGQRRASKTPKPVDGVKALKTNRSNRADTQPGMDMYNTILNMKGGGQKAADAFAKKVGIKL